MIKTRSLWISPASADMVAPTAASSPTMVREIAPPALKAMEKMVRQEVNGDPADLPLPARYGLYGSQFPIIVGTG